MPKKKKIDNNTNSSQAISDHNLMLSSNIKIEDDSSNIYKSDIVIEKTNKNIKKGKKSKSTNKVVSKNSSISSYYEKINQILVDFEEEVKIINIYQNIKRSMIMTATDIINAPKIDTPVLVNNTILAQNTSNTISISQSQSMVDIIEMAIKQKADKQLLQADVLPSTNTSKNNNDKEFKKNDKDRKNESKLPDNKPQTKNKSTEKKIEKPIPIKKVEPEIIITINPKKMLTKEQEKNPFILNFFSQLENFLRKEVQIEKGQKLLVAMSGGVDSSVLFDALAVLSMKMKFIIYVLHFNHKLRGLSSERDEKLVGQLSKDYNVQYFNASGNVKQFAERNSLSIEYAARQLRYNFFEKVARTLNANFVATAHTADDNVETFFLNLFRGSGLTGLSGIPSKRNLVKNVMMIRPLINFRKRDLIEYAKVRHLKWFEDETNSLLNYTRNKIRLSLIPRLEEEFNPSITDIIRQTSHLMSGADRLIRDIVKKNYPLVVEDASQEKFIIKLPMLMANEEFIQGEIIQHLWLKYFRLQPLPMQTINRILSLHNSQSGAICEINSLYFVLRDRNNLIFTKRQYEENIKLMINIPGKYFIGRYKLEFSEIDRNAVIFDENSNIEYFDISIKDSFLEIRNWSSGDSFQPLGMKGEMKVSDFLINEKIPITEKASMIVLTNKTDIIWIIGKRISEKFKIKKDAKKVIKAVLIKNDKK